GPTPLSADKSFTSFPGRHALAAVRQARGLRGGGPRAGHRLKRRPATRDPYSLCLVIIAWHILAQSRHTLAVAWHTGSSLCLSHSAAQVSQALAQAWQATP